ncbi:Ld-bro-a [Lymantria dispar multiple nucleopolyhedrovirus]|uniref:Ld-bro-a n=1 Tax=Lymantria dispar multicapsid nuclear polyhedrosis virus TaxID=10449 RepID=Q9YMU2_NPVLD|nr:Ld-bro-a [Lymantria dispar multiple nucleopolyhedrovirus]AAC70217.1 Ld-bro-a [Lymantria dispar multiple nucleopolyhedrovirus]
MALSKVEFVNGPLEVFTVQDDKQENWMAANPFAETLKYLNVNRAIRVHVSKHNQKTLDELQSDRNGLITSSLHPQTKFINRAGVFELISASEMPAAKRFKQWNANDLLPSLCREGEYSMSKDAPSDIAQGMNAVHAATNQGREAPWATDLEFYKSALAKKDDIIVEKDKIIVAKTEQNQQLASALQEANQNLIEANKGLMTAFNMINDARKETAQLANRMADIAQDVITKPSDPRLCHSLAVCSLGGDQYAFLRPQKRNLKRSLDRLSVDNREIVYKSEYVPNAMNVLNKVKESLPRDKFKARHNKITLLEDLTKEDLVDAIDRSLTQRQVSIIAKNASANSKVDYLNLS